MAVSLEVNCMAKSLLRKKIHKAQINLKSTMPYYKD